MENYSVRQISNLSGYSQITITRIKNYWLDQTPKENIDYSNYSHLVIDATYFHKDGCMLNLMDTQSQKIISHIYVKQESFLSTYKWLLGLSHNGLCPDFITTDGEPSTMRAIQVIWPRAKLQRCLYHLQHEGMRWLRSYPKTEAGKDLRIILSKLSRIKTINERDAFIDSYNAWLIKYHGSVQSLPRTTVAFKDLKRTIVLINNALPCMFHYLIDCNIHPTTNALEGFHSRIKSDYQRHRGLTKEHRISYLNWYCYFKNVGD